ELHRQVCGAGSAARPGAGTHGARPRSDARGGRKRARPSCAVRSRKVSVTAKRILVTGGAGFLGSHLCERLVRTGQEGICLDNFFTGRRETVDRLIDDHRFELMRHDVPEPLTLEVDEIYHLACPASPVHYQRNPVRTIRTGVVGTLNMLDVARDA